MLCEVVTRNCVRNPGVCASCREGKHSTHMAVPYRACGTPSQRSEFKHPDANLCLTQLAYMQRGLTEENMHDCISALFDASLSQREALFRCLLHTFADS